MEKKFVITCDSSCDLPQDFLKRNEIEYIKIKYSISDDMFYDDLSYDGKNSFYKRIRNQEISHTGLYKKDECLNLWNKMELPIIHICLTGALSNCYSQAVLASKEIDKEVYVLDPLIASLGIGMVIFKAIELQNSGASANEAYNALLKGLLNINTIYTTPNLESLYKSGRISKSKCVIGKLLHINPILKVKNDGSLYVDKKVHGTSKTEKEIIEDIKNTAIEPENNILYICHADAYEDAKELGRRIKEYVGFKDIYISLMGPTIASHTGADLKAFFYYGKERK